MPLLEIKNLQLEFSSGPRAARAVDGVSLSLDAGKTLCLVGESGSGKSVTALSIARLLPSQSASYIGGEVLLEGRDVLKMSANELRAIRRDTPTRVSHHFSKHSRESATSKFISAQIRSNFRWPARSPGMPPAVIMESVAL